MEFQIEGNEMHDAAQGAPAPVSPLAALRARRDKIVGELFIDIRVPRWNEPEIFVRFKPVSTTRLSAAIEKRRKSKDENWSVLANADVLIDSCFGIYAVMPEDPETKLSLRPNEPHGKWTKFDPDLCQALGLEANRASDAVLGLYLTEGDLIETANRLLKWSNIASDEADEAF